MHKQLNSSKRFDALFSCDRYLCSVAAAIIGSAVVGGVAASSAASKQSKAANKATEAQSAAAADSNKLQKQMYDQNRKDATPWRNAGVASLNQLNTLMKPGGNLNRSFTMADYQADPGYQFRLDEGNRGVERSAAARGGQLSGATMKALQKYGQGMASDEYGNAYNRFNNDKTTQFNRLSGIAGTGQQASNQIGQYGSNYANQVGNTNINTANQIGSNMIGAGNARAGSYMATANSINGAIGTGVNAWQQQQYLNNMNNMTAYGTTPGSQQSNMLAAQW